jgi:hypothetical protein
MMIAKVYDLMGRPAGEKDSKDFKVKCFFNYIQQQVSFLKEQCLEIISSTLPTRVIDYYY